MKRIEELGISPWPWKLCRDGEIVHGNGYSLTDGDGYFVLKSDSRLIAAAPELYEALREAVEFIADNSEYIGADCDTVAFVARCRSALAKAAGEEVANG